MKLKLLLILLLTIVLSACVKFEPIVRYTEPDETWEYTPLKLENVIEYHGSNSKRGYVYWMIYTDYDYGWSNQVISMDWETCSTLILMLKETNAVNVKKLMEEHEPTILYKKGYQPVLVLTDKD